jgi:hypothetical protein
MYIPTRPGIHKHTPARMHPRARASTLLKLFNFMFTIRNDPVFIVSTTTKVLHSEVQFCIYSLLYHTGLDAHLSELRPVVAKLIALPMDPY